MERDSLESRQAAARRFLAALPVEAQIIEQMVAAQPGFSSEEKVKIARVLRDRGDVESIMVDVWIQHLSAEHLDALAQFYASPAARSLLKTQAIVQEELRRRMTPVMEAARREALGY